MRARRRSTSRVLDVTPVFAQMDGDPVGARVLGDARGLERVGIVAPARLAQRRDVVDVDAEAAFSGAARRAEHLAGDADDALRHLADAGLVLALDHDAEQRLGARVAHQHAAALAEGVLGARDRRLQRPAPSRRRGLRPTGTLSSTCGKRLHHLRAARRAARPVSTISASTASAVISPSPVVLWSRKTMCPDCSPPRL